MFAKLKTLLRFASNLRLWELRRWFRFVGSGGSTVPKVSVQSGKTFIFSGLENDALFKTAISDGIHEPHFEELARFVLAEIPDGTALDLGANIGTHALLLSTLVPNGTVIAVEPQGLVYSLLQNNVLLNQKTNIQTLKFACLDVNDEIVSLEPFSFAGENINNGARRLDQSGYGGELVLTKCIDSIPLQRLDFLKCDVQGSEVKALQGARATIQAFRPYMFIEVEHLHLVAAGSSAKELIELVLSLDYVIYRIENDYPCDHICVPSEVVQSFERTILPTFSFKLSRPIRGTQVDLTFATADCQNYETIMMHD